MDQNNILLKKVPDRLTNILKGLGIIVVSAVLSAIIFFIIIFSGGGFLSDVPGRDYSTTAWMVSGIIFLASLFKAIKIIMRSVR